MIVHADAARLEWGVGSFRQDKVRDVEPDPFLLCGVPVNVAALGIRRGWFCIAVLSEKNEVLRYEGDTEPALKIVSA